MSRIIQVKNDLALYPSHSKYPRLWKGLHSSWPINIGITGDSVRDYGPNKDHAVLTGMDAATDWTFGERGSQLDFVGDGQYLDIAKDIGDGGIGSILMWVKPSFGYASGSPFSHNLIGIGPVSGGFFALYYDSGSSNRRYRFTYRFSFGSTIQISSDQYSSQADFERWTPVCVTWDNVNGAQQLFIDGDLHSSGSALTNSYPGNTGWRIGDAGINARSWTGSIASVQSYGRILATEEIRLLSTRPSILHEKQPYEFSFISAGGGSQTLTPNLYTNTQTFFTHSVTTDQALEPSLYTNTQTFYNHEVAAEQNIDVGLYTNGQTFYSPVVTQGVASQDIEPSLYTNTQTFYSPALELNIDTGLYTNTQTFYSADVSVEKLLEPQLYANSQVFYTPHVSIGTGQGLFPDLFVNSQGWFYHIATGGKDVSATTYDILQEVFKLSNRAQGRMKSKFPAIENIPSDATFDFVSKGVNYKIPIMDFLTSLNVTGSIEQDGSATGAPVLDKQGSVHKIRNIESGPGVYASISAENGITIEHNFQPGSGGEPILTGISDSSPKIANIIAGPGITVTSVTGGIQISVN